MPLGPALARSLYSTATAAELHAEPWTIMLAWPLSCRTAVCGCASLNIILITWQLTAPLTVMDEHVLRGI